TSQTKLINLFAFYKGCIFINESGLAYCIGENNINYKNGTTTGESNSLRFHNNLGIYYTNSEGATYNSYQWTYKLIRCSVFDNPENIIGNSKNILWTSKSNSTFRCTGDCTTYGISSQNWDNYFSNSDNGMVSLGEGFILKNYSGECLLKGYGKANNGEFGNSTNISSISNY
ncbi:hypothetical protein ACTPED_20225, partial [Clostridioides difficile]